MLMTVEVRGDEKKRETGDRHTLLDDKWIWHQPRNRYCSTQKRGCRDEAKGEDVVKNLLSAMFITTKHLGTGHLESEINQDCEELEKCDNGSVLSEACLTEIASNQGNACQP
jgi:hypothetical protein